MSLADFFNEGNDDGSFLQFNIGSEIWGDPSFVRESWTTVFDEGYFDLWVQDSSYYVPDQVFFVEFSTNY